MCSTQKMSQDELRRAIVSIQMDATIDESEKAARRQALLTGKWKPGDGNVKAVAVSADATATAATANAAPSGAAQQPAAAADGTANENMFDESLKCAICMDLCVRPVTAPCQHNFCLGCFTKWTQQGKRSCPNCRATFPNKFCENARVNTALVLAIRVAKANSGKPRSNNNANAAPKQPQIRIIDRDRPLEAFTTERAQRSGRANAASGRILVTIPSDWFGPIPAEHCPEPPHSGERGIEVGDTWADRLDCRQYGAHFPHVAGIAGQSHAGAQSVVLSGGYSDDIDEGEYFLYTGSGGRDLSGNKRIAKFQSKHQTFTSSNEALRRSCELGLPVRVVRSHKEKRSAYAPSAADAEAGNGLRYDGIYKIVAAYRRPGAQVSPCVGDDEEEGGEEEAEDEGDEEATKKKKAKGKKKIKAEEIEEGKNGQRFLVCRYVFVRCDNSPAPWSEDETGGDDPNARRPDAAGRGWVLKDGQQLPSAAVEDMRSAVSFGPGEDPNEHSNVPVVTLPDLARVHWDYDATKREWGWARPRPQSCKGDRNRAPTARTPKDPAVAKAAEVKALRRTATNAERALAKEFTCKLCSGVLNAPLSMPCGHHFCGPCLEKEFASVDASEAAARLAAEAGGRPLRGRRYPKPCPKCKADCASSLEDARTNVAMAEVISKLQESALAARAKADEIEKTLGEKKQEGGQEEVEEEEEDDDESEATEAAAAAAGPSNAATSPVTALGAPAAPAAAATAEAAAPPRPPQPSAAERAAAAASAALAQLKAELGPELSDSLPDFFLTEAIEGHDGDVRAASIEVRKTLQAQRREERKAAKAKEAEAAVAAVGSGTTAAAKAPSPLPKAKSPSKSPSAAANKRPASASVSAAPTAAAADAQPRKRGRPRKNP